MRAFVTSLTKLGRRSHISLLPAILFLSCQSTPYEDWHLQLEASSPCYSVDLGNGLDEVDVAEIQNLFGCLNRHRHLESLEYVAEELSSPSTTSHLVGTDLAMGLNQVEWIDSLSTLMSAESESFNKKYFSVVENAALELFTGQSFETSRTKGFDIEASVFGGIIPPLVTTVPTLSRTILANDEITGTLSNALNRPELPKLFAVLDRFKQSDSPAVKNLVRDMGDVWGQILLTSNNAENNRWSMEYPNSFRTVLHESIESGFVSSQSKTLETLLDDPRVLTALISESVDLYLEGKFIPAGSELRNMVQVDLNGNTLQNNEASAFEVSARLLSKTNRSFSCSVDLWVGDIEISIDNAAVTLLETVADMDPEQAISTGSWISSLLGVSISNSLLDAIVSSGLCDGLTSDLVNDLQVLEYLFSSRNEHLAESFVRILHMFKAETSGSSHIPEVVALISESYDAGLTRPVEELLRDTLSSDLTEHLGLFLSIIHQLETYQLTELTDNFEIKDTFNLLKWFVEDSNSHTPLEDLLPILQQIAEDDGVWIAIKRLAFLMGDNRSQWSQPFSLLPPIKTADSAESLLQAVAEWLSCAECVDPLLRIASTDRVLQKLFATSPDPKGHESPTVFFATLFADSTFIDLVNVFENLFQKLNESDAP